MPCVPIIEAGKRVGFMCMSGRTARCACGRRSTRLCDWKTPEGKKPTCSKPLCGACTHAPAPDKDLCPTHAAAWKARLANSGALRAAS